MILRLDWAEITIKFAAMIALITAKKKNRAFNNSPLSMTINISYKHFFVNKFYKAWWNMLFAPVAIPVVITGSTLRKNCFCLKCPLDLTWRILCMTFLHCNNFFSPLFYLMHIPSAIKNKWVWFSGLLLIGVSNIWSRWNAWKNSKKTKNFGFDNL